MRRALDHLSDVFRLTQALAASVGINEIIGEESLKSGFFLFDGSLSPALRRLANVIGRVRAGQKSRSSKQQHEKSRHIHHPPTTRFSTPPESLDRAGPSGSVR